MLELSTQAEYTNYFAADAKYSNSYAHWVPNRHRQMFIANVLTGSMCVPAQQFTKNATSEDNGVVTRCQF